PADYNDSEHIALGGCFGYRLPSESAKIPPLPKGFERREERPIRRRRTDSSKIRPRATPETPIAARADGRSRDGGRMRAVLGRYVLVVGRWAPHYKRACFFATHRSSSDLSHCAWCLALRRSRLGRKNDTNQGL